MTPPSPLALWIRAGLLTALEEGARTAAIGIVASIARGFRPAVAPA